MKKLYSPQIKVELFGFVSGSGHIDITDWFGDQCVIRTSKGIMEPAGSFSIVFLDKVIDETFSVYAKIEPMDGIKISVAHDGTEGLTTIMRGFVSDVRREETMGEHGRPSRRVVVTGQDAGVFWLIHSLYFLPTAADAQKVLTGYGIFEKYTHTAPKNIPGNEFVATFANILNWHATTLTADTQMAVTIAPAAEGDGDIPCGLLQNYHHIPIHQFMTSLLDVGAFHEMWMDDPGEGAVQLRWRPLWSGPFGLQITEEEISSISVWRNHSRVQNWFWAFPRGGAIEGHTQAYLEAIRAGGIPDARHEVTCHEHFYGFRQVNVQMSLRPPAWPANKNITPKDDHTQATMSMTDWIKNRTQRLRDLNVKNAVLENCTVKVRGNEKIRPGTWIQVTKEEVSFMYYATRVEHEIALWGGFATTVHGERGERWSGQGTYRSEMDLKGVLK